MFLVMCHTCLWVKHKQFQSQRSFITNKLRNKFHIFTCIVDYSNLFCLFLTPETFRSSLLYVDKWNLLYSVTCLCVNLIIYVYLFYGRCILSKFLSPLRSVSKRLTLTAVHWTKTCVTWPAANLRSGEHCTHCQTVKWSEWRVMWIVI
jgi:hypothetical protein